MPDRSGLRTPISPARGARIAVHLALLPVYAWLIFAWSSYAIDISASGRLDRSGHIKGHDFVHFYVLGQIAIDRAADELYSYEAQARRTDALVPQYEDRFLPVYPPQVSLAMAPLAALPYLTAFASWSALTAVIFGICCYLLARPFANLREVRGIAVALTAGYPPFYLLVAHGQLTIIALASVTAGYLALRAERPWLAGLALGLLAYKPALGLVLPFVLLYGREWRVLGGVIMSAVLQGAVAWAYFGPSPLEEYWRVATHIGEVAHLLEPNPHQMQSFRTFFSLLLPWSFVAGVCYLIAAGAAIVLAARCWRREAPLELRYSVFLLATILVDPHVNAYDLVVLAPVFILTIGQSTTLGLERRTFYALLGVCYFAAILTFATKVTHLQFSVIALTILLLALAHESGAIGRAGFERGSVS